MEKSGTDGEQNAEPNEESVKQVLEWADNLDPKNIDELTDQSRDDGPYVDDSGVDVTSKAPNTDTNESEADGGHLSSDPTVKFDSDHTTHGDDKENKFPRGYPRGEGVVKADELTPRTPGGSRLPALTPNQAQIARIPSPTDDIKREAEKIYLSRQNTRLKYPPQVLRLTTVTMSPKSKLNMVKSPSVYIEDKKRADKVVTWDEATNCRPPLRIDLEGPTPWTYSPRNKPLMETNSPVWSFGRRCFVEKSGGSRTSWEKSWFQQGNVWVQKTDFFADRKWPSPPLYEQRPTLGPRQSTKPEFPSFSIGIRKDTTLGTKTGSEREPAPNEYNKQKSDMQAFSTAPSFSHGMRRGGTVLWGSGEITPGPGSYNPHVKQSKPRKPAFTIRGIRRTKTHELGPFSTF